MAAEINHSETHGPNVDKFLELQPTLPCFLPICLYSFMANRRFLQAYLPWVISRCSRSEIIICDYIERHNIMVFNSIPEREAIEKATNKGDKVRAIIETIIHEAKGLGSVNVDAIQGTIESTECQSIANSLREYASVDSDFEADLAEQTERMLNGNPRTPIHRVSEIRNKTEPQLHEYMIEELALYIHLYNQGFTTEVYPGRDMNILKKIADFQYDGFPFDLSERTHISVAVLLDGETSYAQLDNNDEGE